MTTFGKLITLMRGQARRGGEAVLDANAQALLDQQLFDAEQGLIRARKDLSALMAERLLQEKALDETQKRLAQHEDYVRGALAKEDEGLALEAGERVAELEERRDSLVERIAELRQRESEFRQFMEEVGDTLRQLRQQQAVARVSERVHSTTLLLGGAGTGLAQRLDDSRETLERIRGRQERARMEWQAQRELAGDRDEGFEQRLRDAGLVASRTGRARDVIERLRKPS